VSFLARRLPTREPGPPSSSRTRASGLLRACTLCRTPRPDGRDGWAIAPSGIVCLSAISAAALGLLFFLVVLFPGDGVRPPAERPGEPRGDRPSSCSCSGSFPSFPLPSLSPFSSLPLPHGPVFFFSFPPPIS